MRLTEFITEESPITRGARSLDGKILKREYIIAHNDGSGKQEYFPNRMGADPNLVSSPVKRPASSGEQVRAIVGMIMNSRDRATRLRIDPNDLYVLTIETVSQLKPTAMPVTKVL
jgi:hypothetical protein